MKFTLPKNRILPIILFAVACILISILLGQYQMNRMVRYSYKTELDTYDKLTDNVASLIKQEIESDFQSLQVSADLVAKAGTLDKFNIAAILPILTNKEDYIDLAIVGNDGTGYNLAGETIDVSKEEYYITAKGGTINADNRITYTKDNVPVIVFAAPIMDKDIIKGVLLAKVSAKVTNLAPFQSELENGSLIYIINQDNQLVFFLQDTNAKEFNYNKVVSEGYFRSETKNKLPLIGIKDFYINKNNKPASFLWDRKTMGINNWSVLVGRPNTINPVTKDIYRVTTMMWLLISISTLLLFLLLIITQRRTNQKIIRTLYLDPVTGGENWYRFRNYVNKLLTGKQFVKKNYALVNFDINRFKIINDAYGYQKGDEILKEIYNVIKRWVKPAEPFTRYAADQFYILMDYEDEDEIKYRLNDLSEGIRKLRYMKEARISYGVYFISERNNSIDRMGEFASIAKNNSKLNTEGNVSFFDDAAKDRLFAEEKIENEMSDALKNGEFHVYLQPKYSANEEKVIGAEALVRWYLSNGSIVSPGYFIPVFEKNGFITKLDDYMLRMVCKIIRGWLDKSYTPVPISVNISRLHFAKPNLAEIISSVVDEYKVPHNLIELELTESAFLQNKQRLIDTVIMLRKYGFLVSMDDFGAGYSSLNSLKELPLDIVKLDGELFKMTDEVERGLTVIRNTITMAKDLHMKVVAECIETKEQVEYLCTVGCDMIQGFYFARPMPLEQFEQRYFCV